MRARSGRRLVVGVALTICVGVLPLSAEAGDFFSNFFGAFGVRPSPPPQQIMLPFTSEAPSGETPRPRLNLSLVRARLRRPVFPG
jgi:hypothetical protein